MKEFKVVGKSVKRVDGISLVKGKPVYVDDFYLPGMLYAKVLRSPHAHAIIKRIDTRKALKLKGVVAVFTYKDVPRIPFTTAGQGSPEPSPYDTFILDKKVRFVGDRVALVVAEREDIAEEALNLIDVEYEVLPAVFDPRKADEKGAPVIHDEKEAYMPLPLNYNPKKNIVTYVEAEVGNLERGFKEADVVIENEYECHYSNHVPIETHIVITYFDERDRLVIRTSTQVPFHVRRIVARALNIPVKKIRVVKPRIGGGFGAKQEILNEELCAFATLKTGRPVRLLYTRREEFMSGRTRHPQIIKLKVGAKKDGTLSAVSMNVLMNTGAYGSHGATVLFNTGSKVLPLYKCENVRFVGKTVYTNLPVGGAYRGYGATQGHFAFGIMADEIAEAIGMDTLEFLKKVHIKEGEGSPIFRMLGEGKEGVEQKITSCGLPQCIELGSKEIDWKRKREEYLRERNKQGRFKRGVGMVILMQGSSIPEVDMGSAYMKMNDDGSFNLHIGATDLGTGSDTVLAQIAAETIGISVDKIIVYSSDTDFTPFDVGAYASSTTYLSGMAVLKVAEKVREQILMVAGEMLGESKENLKIEEGIVYGSKGKVTFEEIALYSLYQKNQFQIQATSSSISHKSPPPFSAHFAEVEVDTYTGKVKVLKYVSATDCGTAINPKLAEGQIEGAVINGIGYALCEEYIFDDKGRMLNPTLAFYKIYGTRDLPEIKTILVPTYEETGPYGAKSVSEICINGPAPAISNAIYNACGIRLRKTPFTSERVYKALKEKNEKMGGKI